MTLEFGDPQMAPKVLAVTSSVGSIFCIKPQSFVGELPESRPKKSGSQIASVGGSISASTTSHSSSIQQTHMDLPSAAVSRLRHRPQDLGCQGQEGHRDRRPGNSASSTGNDSPGPMVGPMVG